MKKLLSGFMVVALMLGVLHCVYSDTLSVG